MSDFLLELLSEEIPARMQAKARGDLARMMAEALAAAGLGHDGIRIWSTPRRLALIARGLPAATEAVSEEIKGPKTSAPQQALDGFLRKTGLTRDQLQDRDGVWFAVTDRPGRATADVLAEAVAAIVRDFPWPKSMRWGAASASTASLRWVRPLHSIVALLGEAIVPVAVDGVNCGAATLGHRFHHPGAITIGGAHDYVEKLRACHVLVDHAEREAIIRKGAVAAAKKAGFALVEDDGLVVENAGLTEWPVPLLGSFDPDYLDVPPEVIQLTARTNQKYFVMRDGEGRLAPHFVCTANIDANDGGAAIIAGNERVLAARLSDARFFWQQDLKVPLEEQAKKLEQIVFHEKLGTVADKVERVAKLARWLVEEGIIPLPSREGLGVGAERSEVSTVQPTPDPSLLGRGELATLAERAARLAKADLVTGMVGEFPELQGVIGGHLARAQGEPDAIADAIRDHYKPVGQGDDVPTAPVTVAVSVADKLDTLVSFFAVNERPTGSKDPFALRRTALGLLETAIENDVRLPIRFSIAEAYGNFVLPVISTNFASDWDVEGRHQRITQLNFKSFLGRIAVLKRQPTDWTPEEGANESYTPGPNIDELLWFVIDDMTSVVENTSNYLFDRMEERQRREGKRYDLVRAVLTKKIKTFTLPPFGSDIRMRVHDYRINDDPIRLLARVTALQAFVETGEGANLLAGYKRAANILRKEDGSWTPDQVRGDGELVADEAALAAALDAAGPTATAAVEAENFTAAMSALASLRAPIDAFFDKVIVNDPDPGVRARRLGLLARFRDAVHAVADFSKIEG